MAVVGAASRSGMAVRTAGWVVRPGLSRRCHSHGAAVRMAPPSLPVAWRRRYMQAGLYGLACHGGAGMVAEATRR